MIDELKTCTAAFFRNKGKEVITASELIMSISLDLRWMDATTASRFMKLIAANKLITSTKDGLIKASGELSTIDVPVAYRPSKELLDYISTANTIEKTSAEEPKIVKKTQVTKTEPTAILPKLMDVAVSCGMQKGAFIAECNKIVKKLNVDTEVAALLVLRDKGANVAPYYDAVYTHVSVN